MLGLKSLLLVSMTSARGPNTLISTESNFTLNGVSWESTLFLVKVTRIPNQFDSDCVASAENWLNSESRWLLFRVTLTRNRVDSQLTPFRVKFDSVEIRVGNPHWPLTGKTHWPPLTTMTTKVQWPLSRSLWFQFLYLLRWFYAGLCCLSIFLILHVR